MTEIGQPVPKGVVPMDGTPFVDDALEAIDRRDDAARETIENLSRTSRQDAKADMPASGNDIGKDESKDEADRAASRAASEAGARSKALTVIEGEGRSRHEADLAAMRQELANITATLGRLSKAAASRAGEKVGEAGQIVREKAMERPYATAALAGLASLAVYLIARPPRQMGAQLRDASQDLFHRLSEMDPRNSRRRSWF
ncbi:hypothetical protein BTR14_19935 [Rhizobium rhizosphaerae]|uniref:DUF3618 domain-containing protein n=1 Tax=Xaviernesmea rhizosphaerae TaxID=1672749 RepID=A0ABX3P801_9HYPH|nr:hypothetical protein [Xaviernesmea rhizosphaerae]OQP84227.1 hypothetical protein BTR14_19935 [Xaviernesmea rhizosphaerae]